MILEKIWKFLWKDNSVWSWVISIILAFLIVKFLIYPALGLILGTGFPIVAVVSGSMEHTPSCPPDSVDCDSYMMCGQNLEEKGFYHLDKYWDYCGEWYENNNITFRDFDKYPHKNGFNKGDVMVLWGDEPKDIKVGDVVVFDGNLDYPIIHRVVKSWQEDEKYYFATKGDNNDRISNKEEKISEDDIIGKAVARLPLLGWIKIKFNEVLYKIF